jgi:thioredoxin-dependent peroxiredoxin
MALSEGARVPRIALASTASRNVSLNELDRAILYFYPKDQTPGCTAQACSLRDGHAAIRAAGWTVYGVSTDPITSHERFISKHDLPFELLSDPNHEAARAFDVWAERSMFGNTFFSAKRVTFAIRKGTIVHVWLKVDVNRHADEVLAWIEADDAR